MKEIHTGWLFAHSYNKIQHVELTNAPFLTDDLLINVANELISSSSSSSPCALQTFEMKRENLSLWYSDSLHNVTTIGPLPIIKQCYNSLVYINLSWCCYVDGDQICEAISSNEKLIQQLLYLNLNACRVSDIGIKALSNVTTLKTLRIQHSIATDVSPLQNCTGLECLHLCFCHNIIPQQVKIALNGFQQSILELCCMGCSDFDKQTSIEIIQDIHPPNLRIFNCLRGTKVRRLLQDATDVKNARNVCYGEETLSLDVSCTDRSLPADYIQ
jgi:hypothetical protein